MFKKLLQLSTLCFSTVFFFTFTDTAHASPAESLVDAVKANNIAVARQLLQQGANPNVLICQPMGIFAISSDKQCSTENDLYSLIWGAEMRFMNKGTALPILKMLAASGASSSVLKIDRSTEEKVSPNSFPGLLTNMLGKEDGATLALTMVSAGYKPSEEVIQSLKKNLAFQKSFNEEATREGNPSFQSRIQFTEETPIFLDNLSSPNSIQQIEEPPSATATCPDEGQPPGKIATPQAEFDVGECYLNKNTDEGARTAVKWYTQAAKHGLIKAQSTLCNLYSTGIGTKKNENQAIPWCLKAAEQGDGVGEGALEMMYMSGNQRALHAFTKLAKEGSVDAQFMLGIYYYGKHQDRVGYRWLKMAAAHGDRQAQAMLSK